MFPALSVVFLTTLIGVGQGLFLALYTAQIYSLFDLLPAQDGRAFYAVGAVLAVLFLAGGLVASFFHLGRPERAWRAATQWRTSWLSREVIVLPLFAGLVALYGFAHLLGWSEPLLTLPGGYAVDASLVVGAAATVVCFALFVCTGMVYACVRFLQEWHSPLTVINYILLGGASGFVLATGLAAVSAPTVVRFFGGWAVVITMLALVFRVASLVRNARIKRVAALQTAIGIKHPHIRQKAQGFMGGSFNTREFFHGKSVQGLRSVQWAFLVLVFPLPLLLVVAGEKTLSAPSLFAAFGVQLLGLIAERWFFLAQAEHPQNIYYQSIA
jgi:sulfite dehydrogenase (quinone) subunit SoeC